MSESKNRAGSPKPRHARVIKVAPVTRAIRAALAISATSLALAASGAAFAGTCAFPATTSIHCTYGFQLEAMQPVRDLTRVPDAGETLLQPSGGAFGDRHSGIATFGDATFGASDAQTFGPIQDLMAVTTVTPGPGGVSGADDDIFIEFNNPTYSGVGFASPSGGTYSANSTSGIAEIVFASVDSLYIGENRGTFNATGYTWAAGMEVEANDYIHGLRNTTGSTINASTTGEFGQSWGIYGVANNEVDVFNDGTIAASASGEYGTAVGLYAHSVNGDASVDNTYSITATASGYYGLAIGEMAAGSISATATNSGSITASATGTYSQTEAIGLYASANSGIASVANSGDVLAQSSYFAAGMLANSVGGTASAINDGNVLVQGYYQALGVQASSSGDAAATNNGLIDVYAPLGNATGLSAYSTAGNASATNTGAISSRSYYYNATGVLAYSASGIASITNSGPVDAFTVDGTAVGLYGYSASGAVSITNSGLIDAYSYNGIADGIFASGDSVTVDNSNGISAEGFTFAAGIQANGYSQTAVSNTGDITAYAYANVAPVRDIYGNVIAPGVYGEAFGIYAVTNTGGVGVTNSGGITAAGVYATGIYAQGNGPVTVDNSGAITIGAPQPYVKTYVATGLHAGSGDANGSVTITNTGDIYAYGVIGGTGIEAIATGAGSTASVTNTATIYAGQNAKYGYGAAGIVVSADGDATIGNSGAITTESAGVAYGELALSLNGTASVTNSGDIDVHSFGSAYYFGAYGIVAASSNGSASVVNTGNVFVESTYGGGYLGNGILASAGTDATISNSNGVDVNSWFAYGVHASAGNGDASITNTADGSVSAYGYAFAIGTFAQSAYGDASSSNTGSIYAFAYGMAAGSYALAEAGNASISNSGYQGAVSIYGNAYALHAVGATADVVTDQDSDLLSVSVFGSAFGISAQGDTAASVSNDGAVRAVSIYGDNAYGIYADGGAASITNGQNGAIISQAYDGFAIGALALGEDGTATIGNAGSIYANGRYGALGAYASASGDVTLTNSGSIAAISDENIAIGMGGYSIAGNVSLSSTGVVDAYSYDGTAIGLSAYAATGNASLTNTGSVTVGSYDGAAMGMSARSNGDADLANTGGGIVVYSVYGDATGMVGYSYAGNITLSNSGGIDAYSYSDHAVGMAGYSASGNTSAINSGAITAYSYDGRADGIIVTGAALDVTNASTGVIWAAGYYGATGISARGAGAATITNGGSISVYAYAGDASGTGIYANAADVTVSNAAGAGVYAYGFQGYAQGVVAFADDDVVVNNAGAIVANGYYGSVGVLADAGGNASLTNTSSIVAISDEGEATGAHVFGAETTVGNTGQITATGYDRAEGIYTIGSDSATVSNDGSVYATTTRKYGGMAQGVFAASNGDVSIVNGATGVVGAYAENGVAFGLSGRTYGGDVSINNAGAVIADGLLTFGAYARGYDATLTNSGSIYATSLGVSYGANVDGRETATVVNVGSINAISSKYATGIKARGTTVDVTNSGDITVNGYNSATGINADGYSGSVTILPTADSAVSVTNSGHITATSTSYGGKYAEAEGVYAGGDSVTVHNEAGGAIGATAEYGAATGVRAYAFSGDALVTSDGSIDAIGKTAVGVYTEAYGNATFMAGSTGSITATATGDATGVAVYADTGDTIVDNAGAIAATTTGGTNMATGLYAYAYAGNVLVTNSGSIGGHSTGDASAAGLRAQAAGTVVVDNSGAISASDDTYAVAVSLASTGGSTLNNTGTISTDTAREGRVAVLGDAGTLAINNFGDIQGAVIAGDTSDSFTNGDGGLWHPDNHITNFGGGDDAIVNGLGGTIALSNAAIHLGDSDGTGNSFTNNGSIRIRGTSLIDMGTTGSSAMTLAPSNAQVMSNAQALSNAGIIDFIDGAPDDTLTILGDLGGDGAINVDVSALSGTSDMLYVDGNIADGAAQTVNVQFTGIPKSTDPMIPFAVITGNSDSGSFVPGQVMGFSADNFVNLAVLVSSDVDSSNAAADTFSLGVKVNGLNGSGVLAATIAPSAKSLVNSTIGTWRQRVGVLSRQDDGGLSPWVRFFSDKGEVDAQNTAFDFADSSNFGFDQDNSGQEVGMNFALPGGFNYGVLLGKSKGTQTLQSGAGSDRIDLSSAGLYGTWLGNNGLYVDVSYRWMDFDARLMSAGGAQKARGDANAFNIEAGFNAWNVDGFNIVPQLQYTNTDVNVATLHGSAIEFVEAGGSSSRGRLGVGVDKTIESRGFVWTPYGSISAVKEFNGTSGYAVADTLHGETRADGTGAMLELGLGARKDGFSATGGVNWTDGGAQQSFLGGQLVLRYSW
jgi:hypothetical protein